MPLTNAKKNHSNMRITGHRGAKGLALENTTESFQKALDCNVDEIEFDVRVTKDHVPIIIHDAEVTIDGASKAVKAHTYDELKAFAPELLTLNEVLLQLKNTTALIIEVKPKEPIAPVLEVVATAITNGQDASLIAFASFDFKTLKNLRASLPGAELIVNERWSGVRASHRARKIGTKRLSMNQRWLWSGFIRSMSNSGFELGAYTLNDAAKARRWEKYGLSAAITDFPDRFTNNAR